MADRNRLLLLCCLCLVASSCQLAHAAATTVHVDEDGGSDGEELRSFPRVDSPRFAQPPQLEQSLPALRLERTQAMWGSGPNVTVTDYAHSANDVFWTGMHYCVRLAQPQGCPDALWAWEQWHAHLLSNGAPALNLSIHLPAHALQQATATAEARTEALVLLQGGSFQHQVSHFAALYGLTPAAASWVHKKGREFVQVCCCDRLPEGVSHCSQHVAFINQRNGLLHWLHTPQAVPHPHPYHDASLAVSL